MARKPRTPRQEEMSEEMLALRALSGKTSSAEGWQLDGAMLSIVVQLLTRKGAALQIGTTLSGDSLTLKVFDGGFPLQLHCANEREANGQLQGIARAYVPKGEQWDNVRNWIEAYEL